MRLCSLPGALLTDSAKSRLVLALGLPPLLQLYRGPGARIFEDAGGGVGTAPEVPKAADDREHDARAVSEVV